MAARLVFLREPRARSHTHALSHKCAKWKNRDATAAADEKLGVIGEMGKGQLGLVFASSTRLLPGEEGKVESCYFFLSSFLIYERCSAFLQPHTLTHIHIRIHTKCVAKFDHH
jgi:hypothetical protein